MRRLLIPFIVFGIILLLWSVYRYFFRFPVWIDEIFAKPVLHVVPVLLVVFSFERESWESLGFQRGKIRHYLVIGLILGLGLALMRFVVLTLYGRMPVFEPMGRDSEGIILGILSNGATGLTEELLFRGYLFTRFERITENLWLSLVISSIFFVLIHVPIMLWGYGYDMSQGIRWSAFLLNQGLLIGVIFAYTRSLPVVIGVHAVWNASVQFFP